MVDVYTVKNINELTTVVIDIFEITGTRWWFRGHPDSDWDLWPSLWRRGYNRQQERYLTNLFYTRARMRYANSPNDFDYGAWLALMQHYGLPTRLLDWSASPLIAAYFATKYSMDMGEKRKATDAAIWALEPHRINVSQGYKPIFPPLNARSVEPLVREAMKGGKRSKFSVMAVSPLETDLRMLIQQGNFTVHVSEKPINRISACEDWLKKIVIPKKSVRTMAREVDVLGIRLADIFPDLGNLAREITNMHRSPR